MRLFHVLLLTTIICISAKYAWAQTDSIKDNSLKIHKEIEKFSGQRKSTKFIYKFIFKPVKSPNNSSKAKVRRSHHPKPYSYFEGKIIRQISIVTLDPFGYNLQDTSFVPQQSLYRAGNSLHIKTLPITIKNLLLFRKNQQFDSLLVRESERLIRSQKYVHEITIFPVLASPNSDSVDVFIRVLDEWTIIPGISISSTRFEIELIEKNFLGTGHEYQNDFIWNHTNGKNFYKTNYFIPNIHNTYIQSSVSFTNDENYNKSRSLNVERPFFSPFAKWAAGISLSRQSRRDTVAIPGTTLVMYNFESYSEDYWVGKAWQIFKGNTEDERSTQLILTARYFHTDYLERPAEVVDSLAVYSNEYFYLTGIGISSRKFIEDRYVYNYGLIEDVPIGKVYGLVVGYQVKNTSRLYLGMRFSKGNYHSWGYLNTTLEYGTFVKASHLQQGSLTMGANYFTNLFEVGKWKFRQFAHPLLIVGFNRLPTDNLSINSGQGIKGFNSSGLSGQHKLLLTLQTQSYSPWTVLGFKFGPYFVYSVGMLGDAESGFKNSALYTQLGIGLLIKNEFLVFGIFQVSFAFYPTIPGIGNNIFRYNPDKTSDIAFRDFSISKPEPIFYK